MMKKFCVSQILINIFLVLFNSTNNFATVCVTNLNGYCTFSNVVTTKESQLFHPSTENESNVKAVQFNSSTLFSLTSEICDTFPNLLVLKVNHISLQKIEQNALKNCSKLIEFYMWNNSVSEILNDTFKHNPELRVISFQRNNIKNLEAKIFETSLNLERLAINENPINDIPFYSFPKLIQLHTLYINDDELTDLYEYEMLNRFPKLKTIYMEGNEFVCDRLKNLLEVFGNKSIEVKEWGPQRKSRNYIPLKINNIYCIPETDVKKVVYLKHFKYVVDAQNNAVKNIATIERISNEEYNELINQIQDQFKNISINAELLKNLMPKNEELQNKILQNLNKIDADFMEIRSHLIQMHQKANMEESLKMGIFHINHPKEVLTNGQMNEIGEFVEEKLDDVLESKNNPIIKKWFDVVNNGWIDVTVKDDYSRKWLDTVLSKMTELQVKVSDTEDNQFVSVTLKMNKQAINDEKLCKRVLFGNPWIDCSKWRIVDRKLGKGREQIILLNVDVLSFNEILKRSGGMLYFGARGEIHIEENLFWKINKLRQ